VKRRLTSCMNRFPYFPLSFSYTLPATSCICMSTCIYVQRKWNIPKRNIVIKEGNEKHCIPLAVTWRLLPLLNWTSQSDTCGINLIYIWRLSLIFRMLINEPCTQHMSLQHTSRSDTSPIQCTFCCLLIFNHGLSPVHYPPMFEPRTALSQCSYQNCLDIYMYTKQCLQ